MRLIVILVVVCAVAGIPATSGEPSPRCILPSAQTQGGPLTEEVAGHYSAVSESEWHLEVWLRPDGKAEVVSENWEAGHYDQRTTVRYRGDWSLSGAFVQLRYSGRCETLRFEPSLSFAELGSQGSAPGLQGLHSSISTNLFIGTSLWRSDELSKIPEVE